MRIWHSFVQTPLYLRTSSWHVSPESSIHFQECGWKLFEEESAEEPQLRLVNNSKATLEKGKNIGEISTGSYMYTYT